MKLSVLVITYNEEKHIARCLQSLKHLADEIIVVDSFSSDKTPTLCDQFSVRIIQRDYPGQIEQKQFALSQASYPMILSIDGDEELSQSLAQEILAEKAKGFPYDGYYFNRKAFYCGKWIEYGDWSSEWKLRLWKKDKAEWLGPNPHDKVYLQNSSHSKKLQGLLHHYTFETLAEHERQIQNYAEISAVSNLNRKRNLPLLRIWFSPLVCFVKSFVLKGGFLDGRLGWQLVRLSMKEKHLKYKLQFRMKKDL